MGKIAQFMVMTLIFSSVAMGLNNYWASLSNNYDFTITEDLSSLNKINETYDVTAEFAESLKSDEITEGDVSLIVTGAVIGGKNFITSVTIFQSLVSDSIMIAGLPDWVGGFIIGIVMVISLMAVISLFGKEV